MPGPGSALVGEPAIWSAKILDYLDYLPIYRNALTNTNYEGEARIGGTVRAFWVSDVHTSDYQGAWPESEWELLTQAESILQIDQQRKFIFKVPDVRAEFNVLDLQNQGSMRAAQAIALDIDSYVASKHTLIAPANFLGTNAAPITVGLGAGETRPAQAIIRLRELLVIAASPMTSVRCVVPPWFATMLGIELAARWTALGDVTVGGAGAGAPSPGFVTSIHGVAVYESQRVPSTGATLFKVMMGDPMVTYASAIENIETLRLPNDFATGVKGLYVYGAHLMRGEYMVLGTFNPGSYTLVP